MADQEKEKKSGVRADRYYRDTVGLFAHFPQNVGMGSDLHNSWSGLSYVRARLQYQPVYTASATFTVNIQREQQGVADTGSASFFNNSTAEQMAKTFPYILTSGVLKRKVAKDMDIAAVPGKIKATVAENTNLLTISVTDQDAGRAYATLKSVEKNYPAISEVIVGKANMEMLDETGIPAEPDNPKAFRRMRLKVRRQDFCWS